MDIGKKSNIDRLYIYSFIAVLVLLPWSVRWCNIALVFMVISGLLSTRWSQKIQNARQHWEVVIFIFLFTLYLLGLLYTENVALGLKSVEQKLVLVAIPIIAVSSISFTKDQQKLAQLAFVYSILLLTVACLLHNVISISRGEPYAEVNFDPYTLSRFNEFHANANPVWMQFSYISFGKPMVASPTLFSIYLTLCILILFYSNPISTRNTFLKYVIIVWFCIVIVLLSSRIGILILFGVGILNLFLYLIKKRFAFVYTASSVAFLILLSFLTVLSPVTRFRLLEEPLSTPLAFPSRTTDWNSFNIRLLEWRSGIEGIKNHGVVGTGTGGTLEVLHDYYNQVGLGYFDNHYHANNQFIEAYLEIGIAGFIALSLCFIVPFVRAVKNKDMLLLSVILMIGLGCLSNSLFERASGLTFYISFVSLFMFTTNVYGNREAK